MSVLSDFLRTDAGRIAMPALVALGIAASVPVPAAAVPVAEDGGRPAISLADIDPALRRLHDDLLFEIAEATQDLAVSSSAVGRIAATTAGGGGYMLAAAGMRADAIAAAEGLGGGTRFEDPEAARRRDKLLMKAVGIVGFAAACYFGRRAYARRPDEPEDPSRRP